MRFREALKISTRRLGLTGYPDARLGQAGAYLILGAALLALHGVSARIALVGAGVWLCGLVSAARGLTRFSRETR